MEMLLGNRDYWFQYLCMKMRKAYRQPVTNKGISAIYKH